MNRKNSFITAILLGGAVGLVANPVWSQSTRSSEKQSVPPDHDKVPTKPGDDQNLPPRTNALKNTSGMSKQDIQKVEEALQAKGHNPGKVDGVMDDQTRDAIRAFQKANNLTLTGTIDDKTAAALGVTVSSASGKSSDTSSSPSSSKSGSGSMGTTGPEGSGAPINKKPENKMK
jgi:peptidoglycan hydrolase-like protein with peptidoglycan-binding domain